MEVVPEGGGDKKLIARFPHRVYRFLHEVFRFLHGVFRLFQVVSSCGPVVVQLMSMLSPVSYTEKTIQVRRFVLNWLYMFFLLN